MFVGLFEKPAWAMGIFYISLFCFVLYMSALFIKLADYTRSPEFKFGALYILDSLLVTFSVVLLVIFYLIFGIYVAGLIVVISVGLTTFSFDKYDD